MPSIKRGEEIELTASPLAQGNGHTLAFMFALFLFATRK
jgi:hypothetical protein